MRHCSCPAYWDWSNHEWCPIPDDPFSEPEPEETFYVERQREIGERFAYDTDTDD